MKNKNNVVVDIKLNEGQIDILRKSINDLPDFHIGKIFGKNCIDACEKNNGLAQLIAPCGLDRYLLEPGNAFDAVPGLVSYLTQQINLKNYADICDDEYGYTLKGFVSSEEYDRIRDEINKYPEYHMIRTFLESGIHVLKNKEHVYMLNQRADNEHLPSLSIQFPVYCFKEIVRFIGEDVASQIVKEKKVLGVAMLFSCAES